jgi:transcriptional regulator with XRE-family HTH domain
MKTLKIKIEIYRRRTQGVSQSSIAKSLGVSPQAVSNVIMRRNPSRRIAQAVADAIERPLAEVFPEYCESENSRRAACR